MYLARALVLRDGDRSRLEALTRGHGASASIASRARVVLLASEGVPNVEIAHRANLSRPSVLKWRNRYGGLGFDGLKDAPRPGRAPVIDELAVIHMYKRKVGPQNDGHFRWAADWWNYPEALARLEAMWRAWEHLRLDGATGSSMWWIEHADHHMPILLDPGGPFTKSTDRNKHGEPLPHKAPPKGLFPDVRE